MAGLDLDTIRFTLETARRVGIHEVSLSIGDSVFEARLAGAPSAPVAASPVSDSAVVSAPAEPVELGPATVNAAQVGFFDPLPDLAGKQVAKGDVLGTIHALGIDNEVRAPQDGKIHRLLVDAGEGVEFGQPLMEIS